MRFCDFDSIKLVINFVLNYVISNEFKYFQVKDSISEIALLMTDKEKPIAGLARLFFQELSKKGTIV